MDWQASPEMLRLQYVELSALKACILALTALRAEPVYMYVKMYNSTSMTQHPSRAGQFSLGVHGMVIYTSPEAWKELN